MDSFKDGIFWMVILAVMLIIGAVVIQLVKNHQKKQSADDGTAALGGFGLSDLKNMYQEGLLSEEEYEIARNRMLTKARANILGEDDDEEEESGRLDGDSDTPSEEWINLDEVEDAEKPAEAPGNTATTASI